MAGGGLLISNFASGSAPVDKLATSQPIATSSLKVLTTSGAAVTKAVHVVNSSPGSQAAAAKPSTAGPTFTPAVPAGEPQLAHLGAAAFNSAADSYTFQDLFLAEPVQVSEQPVAAASATQTLTQAAASLDASQNFQTNSGTAYLGTAPNGQQAVVFITHGLLVFVESSYEHDASSWTTYLNSLQ